VKTTLEIPDELYRAVKVKAALEGRRVTDVVVEGLRQLLQAQPTVIRRVQLPLIKSKPGGKKITLARVKNAEEANHCAQLMRR
jgi:plasmid stability protein